MKRTIMVWGFTLVEVLLSGRVADASIRPRNGEPLAGISLSGMVSDERGYYQTAEDGREIRFTVIPGLQSFIDRFFAMYEVPAAAAVVLNSRTGRVLAFSQYLKEAYASPSENVALDATPPAASVFKIITTAALMEQADVNLDTRMCYHGGGRRLVMQNLLDSESLDKACRSLKQAFGYSTNAIYAKLSDRLLSADVIDQYARRFFFGREIPFDVEVSASTIQVPMDRLERARAAAGFWHSHLSPLHGAMIVQSIAQDGAMLRPYVVDTVHDMDGNLIHKGGPEFIGRPIDKETARLLREAMGFTVSRGTAHKLFREGNLPIVRDVEVGGKTGTLHGQNPFRAYSWFVGIAPIEKPEVAIAVLLVNSPKWRIRSSYAAARILRTYFETK